MNVSCKVNTNTFKNCPVSNSTNFYLSSDFFSHNCEFISHNLNWSELLINL